MKAADRNAPGKAGRVNLFFLSNNNKTAFRLISNVKKLIGG
jgi:hypothetical protein